MYDVLTASQGGLSHGFVFEFESEEDRDYYLHKDPAHLEFVASLKDIIESARVFDFEPGVYFGNQPEFVKGQRWTSNHDYGSWPTGTHGCSIIVSLRRKVARSSASLSIPLQVGSSLQKHLGLL